MRDDNSIAIKVDNVSKTFKLPHEKTSSIKSALVNFRKRRTYEKQEVLKDISFEIKKGEFFGIVGRNGSGKSTLLKILAGIYTPTDGSIKVNGSLTPFIELGVGFNPELTGRENVFLNGALLGFSRKEMNTMYQEIVDFAEIEKFMDQKLKNYSSGMQVRLAFSIAIRAQSDILLIDEVLAVGDVSFQQKCLGVFRKLKSEFKTIIFVSHDLGAVEKFCDRVLIVNNGNMLTIGNATETIMEYQSMMAKIENEAKPEEVSDKHTGTGDIRINKLDVLSDNKVVKELKAGDEFIIRIRYTAKKFINKPVFGIAIVNDSGHIVTGPNTHEAKFETGIVKGSGQIIARFKTNPLNPGRYTIMASCFDENVTVPYDFVNKAGNLQIIGKERHGIIYLEPQWSSNNKDS